MVAPRIELKVRQASTIPTNHDPQTSYFSKPRSNQVAYIDLEFVL